KDDKLTSALPDRLPDLDRRGRAVLVRRRQAKATRADADEELLKASTAAIVRTGFRDPDPRARRAAFAAMEFLDGGAQPHIASIAGGLSDPDLFVRWVAARVLMRLAYLAEDDQAGVAVPALTRQLQDPELDSRIAATYALAAFGQAAALAAE